MESRFYGARLKVERAVKHINDLQRLGQEFADAHPHIVNIQADPDTGCDRLSIAPAEQLPDNLLLVLGDALHNLRSAIDHAWFQVVTSDPNYRKFPVRETREGVEAAINGLKENACEDIKRFVVDVVQPYRGGKGEHFLALHDLDIEDKHSLLIAHRQWTRIQGMVARDERGEEFVIPDWLIVPPHTASEPFEGHERFQITNFGDARTHVTFGEGMPLQGHYVLPTLNNLTKLVTSLISCFESILAVNAG
jgi:hypothetical protein